MTTIILTPTDVTTPLCPYCSSEDVASLMRSHINNKTDFDATTTPSKAQVDSFISIVCGHINQVFQDVGYIVPFELHEDDTYWPSHQTTYLKMLNIFGTLSMISSKAIHPAASARIRNLDNLTYTLSYDSEIKSIQNSLVFRANYRLGTQAETRLGEPYSAYFYEMPEYNQFFEQYTDTRLVESINELGYNE